MSSFVVVCATARKVRRVNQLSTIFQNGFILLVAVTPALINLIT